MLAIVASIRHFRVYLLCHKFCVVTDHNPLVYIRNSPIQNSRLLRWRLDLEEYDFYVVHKSGILYANADYLSRILVVNDQPIQNNYVRVVTRAQARREEKNTIQPSVLDTVEEDVNGDDEDMVILLGISPLSMPFENYKEFINKNPISNLQVLEIAE